MDPLNIKKRYDALMSQRKTVENTWNIINSYVVPYRGDFFREVSSEHAVEWRDQRLIFDSTAVQACNTLASSLHSSLTSPANAWFEIRFRNEELNRQRVAAQWAEEAGKACFQALYDSNFNLEANETYIDLVSYGTSVIVEEVEEDNGAFEGLNFQSVPIEEIVFEEDFRGHVHKLYRKHMWTAVQIKTKFVKKDGDEEKLPTIIKAQLESTQSVDQKHEVVFCIYPRESKVNNLNSETVLAAEERPFGYKYIFHGSGEVLGDEGGYYEMPAFVPRWRKTSKSKWGNSPAMMCLPDILTLNQLVELILKSTEKVVDPANLVTERGLLSDLHLEPAGLTVVRDLENSLKPYESKARFDVSELQRDALQQSIRQTFFVDQLELKESPAMTATEVNKRWELMQRLLGPTLGRLQSDYLDPLVQRTFNILWRAGKIEALPDDIDNIGELDIVYTGPMARAQRTEVAQGVMQWVGFLAEVAEVFPEVTDVPDPDALARELGMLSGVPARMMKTQAAVNKVRKERKEQMEIQQAQAEGEAAQQVGAGVQALRGVESGSESAGPTKAAA